MVFANGGKKHCKYHGFWPPTRKTAVFEVFCPEGFQNWQNTANMTVYGALRGSHQQRQQQQQQQQKHQQQPPGTTTGTPTISTHQ
jgi:dTDP-4-dehydrorhamnose 3,5-epimerase-like enzyme